MSAQPPNRPPTPPPPPPGGSGGYGSGGYGSGGYGSGGEGPGGDADYSYSDPTPPGRGVNKWLIALAAIVALVIIGGLGYWFGGKNDSKTADPVPTATVSSAAPSASAPPSASASASAAASSAPSAQPSATAAAPTTTTAVTPTPTPTTTSPSPTPTPSPTASPTPGVPVPDFGYITGLETVGSLTYIKFDRATLYTGAAAESAAKAHGQEVEDDYFIVNDNKLIRRLPLAPDVVVTGSTNLSGDVGPKPSSVADLKTWLDTHPGQTLPVNLYYNATGQVSKIAEVFFP